MRTAVGLLCRRGTQRAPILTLYSQFTDNVLLHIRPALRRHTSEIGPKGEREKSPWGYLSRTIRWSGGYRRHLRQFNLIMNVYRRVRQGELPEGQERRCPGVTTSATVLSGWHSIKMKKMENALPRVHSPFRLAKSAPMGGLLAGRPLRWCLHFQFSIISPDMPV